MKTLSSIFAATAVCLCTGPVFGQSNADCAHLLTRGYWSYVILDQSLRADLFREAMKKVDRPEQVGLNHVYGDFSAISANAERHPLVYVFDGEGGRGRQIHEPEEFVAYMNARAACPPQK